MNKYIENSDFEINKKVASHYLPCDYNLNEHTKTVELIGFLGDTNEYIVYGTFDPCNNPPDAMPIIIENGISLITEGDGIYEAIGGLEIYSANSFLCDFSSTSEKIYRAGMEFFLMKRDAENENNNNS